MYISFTLAPVYALKALHGIFQFTPAAFSFNPREMGTDGNMLPSCYGTLDAETAIETLHEHINIYNLNLLAKPYATLSDI